MQSKKLLAFYYFNHLKFRLSPFLLGFIILGCCLSGCKRKDTAASGFYYWKSTFNLDSSQSKILRNAANNKLYVRFFDIAWDDQFKKAYPNAIIHFAQSVDSLKITTVVYITNKMLDSTGIDNIDSLAIKCNKLIGIIAAAHKIRYNSIQFDCDWTAMTKQKYFNFLLYFKKINNHSLQATIRLHQVKYKEVTGIPPVDNGVLMFYNMGKPSSGQSEGNSIYSETDAAKYVDYIKRYPLHLDVALPLFSWALQIRDHHIIQVYEKIKKKQLDNDALFNKNGDNYTANRSFFLNGIYIKENDIFKLEETDINSLQKAAKQLAANLPQQNNRTVIYYELANLDPVKFNSEQLRQISAGF
jgi:hypothetical protein